MLDTRLVLQKISQCCPKKRILHDWTQHSLFWKFSWIEWIDCGTLQKGLRNLSNTDSADRFPFLKIFSFRYFKCFRLKKFYRLQEKYGILYQFAHIRRPWVLGPLENFPYHSLLVLQQLIIFFWHQQPIYALLGYIYFNKNSIFSMKNKDFFLDILILN